MEIFSEKNYKILNKNKQIRMQIRISGVKIKLIPFGTVGEVCLPVRRRRSPAAFAVVSSSR